MKTDRYTKVVLSVIAVALVCLVFQNFNVVTPAQASSAPVISTSAGVNKEVIDVKIVGYSYGTVLPVRVDNNYLYTKPY